MTINSIANKVAFYHAQSRTQFIDSAGDDVIISAINQARKEIEKLHYFNYSQVKAWISVDPDAGGSIRSACLMVGLTLTNTPVNMMDVDTAYIQDNVNSNVWWPLYLSHKMTLAVSAKEQNYKYRGYPNPYGMYLDTPLSRFATDPRNLWPSRPLRAYVQGQSLFIDPRLDLARNVQLDGTTWMPTYKQNTSVSVSTSSTASSSVTLTSSAPSDLVTGSFFLGQLVNTVSGTSVTLAGNANATIASPTVVSYSNMPQKQNDFGVLSYCTNNEDYDDWFTKQAGSYLQWAAVVSINYFTNAFVVRQEGFNAPPEKLRDTALQSLVEWDNFLWNNGMQPWVLR